MVQLSSIIGSNIYRANDKVRRRLLLSAILLAPHGVLPLPFALPITLGLRLCSGLFFFLSSVLTLSRSLFTQPYYHRGNKVLLSIIILNLVLFAFTKVYFVLRNRNKRTRWEALTAEERATYLATTKDEGNRRLDFQFAH